MGLSPRVVTQDRLISWDGVTQRLGKGQVIDVAPGSALEAEIGAQFLVPMPGAEAQALVPAVFGGGGGGTANSTALGGGGGGAANSSFTGAGVSVTAKGGAPEVTAVTSRSRTAGKKQNDDAGDGD